MTEQELIEKQQAARRELEALAVRIAKTDVELVHVQARRDIYVERRGVLNHYLAKQQQVATPPPSIAKTTLADLQTLAFPSDTLV